MPTIKMTRPHFLWLLPVGLDRIHLSLYILLGHLILVLSLTWNHHTNTALHIRHERRCIPPEDAAIFEGIESLDSTFDFLPDSYDEHQLVHQSTPKLPAPRGGVSYNHPLSPGSECLGELLLDREIESESSNHPSSVSYLSETFWRSLPGQLDNDSCSSQKMTSDTIEQTASDEIQCSNPFPPSNASIVNTFPTIRVSSVIPSEPTTNVKSIFQNLGSQNQKVIGTLKSSEPVARRLKRKHPCPSMPNDCSPDEEISFVMNYQVPLKSQHSDGSNVKASLQLCQSERMKALKEAKTPENEMISMKGASSKSGGITTRPISSIKENAFTRKLASSNPEPKSKASTYWLCKRQVEEFFAGLLHGDREVRLSALEKYIQRIWPQVKLTGTESFESLKACIEEIFKVSEGLPSPFYVFLARKEGKKLEERDHNAWLDFLGAYRKCHRPAMLRWATNIDNKSRNKAMHLLCVQAGSRRLKKLGISRGMEDYFAQIERSLYHHVRNFGVIHFNEKNRVNHFLGPVREATISMLYQIELLLRLSTPPVQDSEQIQKDYLVEILNHYRSFWKGFKPFDQEHEEQFEANIPQGSLSFSRTLMNKIYDIFHKKLGDCPSGMSISRYMISDWCQNRDKNNFPSLDLNFKSKNCAELFAFLADCTVHDLVHMISN